MFTVEKGPIGLGTRHYGQVGRAYRSRAIIKMIIRVIIILMINIINRYFEKPMVERYRRSINVLQECYLTSVKPKDSGLVFIHKDTFCEY